MLKTAYRYSEQRTLSREDIAQIIEYHVADGLDFEDIGTTFGISAELAEGYYKSIHQGYLTGPAEIIIKQSKINKLLSEGENK